jgi:hypothetical protein
LKAIDEIGPENVLQVVTDNAANCKAAGKEIEKVSHIFYPSSVFYLGFSLIIFCLITCTGVSLPLFGNV